MSRSSRQGAPAAGLLDWARAGLCHQPTHAGLPWVGEPDEVTTGDITRMTRVCGACPVQAACAAYATQADVTAGFWAGVWHTNQDQDSPDPCSGVVPVEWVPVTGRHGVVIGEQAALVLGGLGGAA
jgi:Transcription factor WhiB